MWTSQLLSKPQCCVNASTDSEEGFQYLELNLRTLVFPELANLSIVWGPHMLSMNSKNLHYWSDRIQKYKRHLQKGYKWPFYIWRRTFLFASFGCRVQA
jgi:hypothetical protein